jgi:hypothetical protein
MADPITSDAAEPQKVKFYYHKGNFFRVIHVDGAIGGLTPTLDIFISVYNQRGPIPQVTVQQVSKEGILGDEVLADREAKEGIVREVEAGLIMNLQTAKALQQWLMDKILLADKTLQQIAEAQPKDEGIIQ